MKAFLQRLIAIDNLIYHKSTGTPGHLAQKVGLSERSLYDYLKILKGMGAPIKFSRNQRTYYYDKGGRFRISFIPKSAETRK